MPGTCGRSGAACPAPPGRLGGPPSDSSARFTAFDVASETRTGACERLDGLDPVSPRREHQRGPFHDPIARVDASAMLQEPSNRVDLPRRRGQHQRSGAARVRRLRVSARLEQRANDCAMAVLGREQQRRGRGNPRCRFQVGAGVDEHLCELEIAAHCRPVQRGHAIALRRADVGALVEQRADGRPIARLGRIGHRCADLRARLRTDRKDYAHRRHQTVVARL